jgi:N-acetylneuraminic acid mutarotase
VILLIAAIDNSFGQNTWNLQADFGGASRYGAVGFSIGDMGYIGTASNENDFWEFDPVSNSWAQKANFGGEVREHAVGFSVGIHGYIGTGNPSFGNNLSDLWQYDPVSNTWTQKADFGGGNRYFAIGFSIGDKGYIGTGYNDGENFKKDFWEYDPAGDTWTEKAELPGKPRSQATGFSIGDKGYIGTGVADNVEGIAYDFYEYDPATDQWTKKASLPGKGRAAAVGFSISDKGYIGIGRDVNFVPLNDFWEYDPVTDNWIQKADFAGSARYFAAGFSIGNKGYIGTGQASSTEYLKDFWEYTPEGCAAPTGITTTNISPHSAKLKWNATPGAAKYKVQYKMDSIGAWWLSKTVNASFTSITIINLQPNTNYKWKVRTICGSDKSAYSSAEKFNTLLRLENVMEDDHHLSVYPNPFATDATISYFLKEAGDVTAEIYDLSGRKILSLINENKAAGYHQLHLERVMLSQGVYLLQLKMNDQISTVKIVAE